MRHRSALALLIASLATGCYREPDVAEILVSTTPPGAACVISQAGQPIATTEPTPAIAILPLVGTEVGVSCRRPGFQDAAVALPPPPPSGIPGYVAARRPEIAYRTRVDLTLLPLPPGMAR